MDTLRESRPFSASLILLLLACSGLTQAHQESEFTSFEFSSTGFSIGASPIRATFADGRAQVIGVGAYYHTGIHAWHVPSGGTATVTFETPADNVNFWVRDTQGAASSEYRVIDTEGAVVGSGNGSQTYFNFVLNLSPGAPRIAIVEFQSFSGGDTVVDDFGFQATDVIPESDFAINLEQPIHNRIHSGIGLLAGWAISSDGVDRVEIFIDGKFVVNVPYGGLRVDVNAVFPDVIGSELSGFGMVFNYGDIGAGQHTILARAFDVFGDSREESSTFTVEAFDKNFIPATEVVDISSSSLTPSGDEIMIEDFKIGEKQYDLKMKWRTAEQGFEIIEIR